MMLQSLSRGIPYPPPAPPAFDESVPHAPRRPIGALKTADLELALKNALRYFPEELHADHAIEFAEELRVWGHIYMFRYRPTHYQMKAHPIYLYPAKCTQAASIQLMIMNNLDPAVAQYPHELVTYGGNGSVFSNWAQYHLAMYYLSIMDESQTLAMYSGHPMGLFPSVPDAPRVVITNGMVIPNYSSRADYEKMYAQGVSQYGQMTAGSYCYIGPQGIVHGTTLTLLNAARKYLGKEDMTGVVYVTSGLGGMSGAQPKAGNICGAISVTAEVDESALLKRHEQGWVNELSRSAEDCLERIRLAKHRGECVSIGYHGNIVTLWEVLAKEAVKPGGELLVDLGSDQTSLHNPYMGGYYPAGLSFVEARKLMAENPVRFKELVRESLNRHVKAINTLVRAGMSFWDYGNSFLLEAARAGANILDAVSPGDNDSNYKFRYPSYVQDIMGDIFSLGFGPFRWVCTSGDPHDLAITDQIAEKIFEAMLPRANERSAAQLRDNLRWVREAGSHKMVVGSQARILYSNGEGRSRLAVAFNDAVKVGRLKGPIVISRDHHDVSGTDSPFRETSNVYDGSSFTADMAVQNVIGDSFRGATWVSIHNGGGVGWGEVMNGGFGMVLDGSDAAGRRAEQMLFWDVNNGISRRAWAGNENAKLAIAEAMESEPRLVVTESHIANEQVLETTLAKVQFVEDEVLVTTSKL